jgi:DNA-binding transcriptional ArsR family regulator
MLGAFAAEERTTRQVAEILGEKPTRLYHHLKSLAAAGLIRKTRTRRNRGTLETYYRAVAGAFRADPALFAPPGTSEAAEKVATVVGTMLDQTASEVRALTAAEGGGGDVQEEGFFGFLEVHAPERDMRKIRTQIDRLVAGLKESKKGATKKAAAGPDRRYRLSIAFFPLDLPRR